MSRSYQKNPGWTDHGKRTRYLKRHASKKVRRKEHFYFENLGNKRIHIRMYLSWDLCDVRAIEFQSNRKKYLMDLYDQRMREYEGRCYYENETINTEYMQEAIQGTYRAFMK